MKVDVYVLCYNELKLAPFAVQYWKRYANRVYVYDNGSDDGTIEYLSQFPELIEIRHYDSDGVDDARYLDIKNNVWKESRGRADFVVVGDFDEFIYADNILERFQYLKDNGYTICSPKWYNLISESFPKIDDNALMHEQVKGSVGNSKSLIFNPNLIEEINYTAGAHACFPSGTVNTITSEDIFCYHASSLGIDFVLNKLHNRRARLSKKNIECGWGIHYLYSDEKAINDFNEELNAAEKIKK